MAIEDESLYLDGDTHEATRTYEKIVCPTCGVTMYVPQEFYNARMEDNVPFRCVAGHKIKYPKLPVEADIKTVEEGKRAIVKLLAQNDQLKSMLRSAREQLVLTRKRQS